MTTRRIRLAASVLLCVLVLGVAVGAAADEAAIGAKARSGAFAFVVHRLIDPYVPDDEGVLPAPGNRFVAVDVEVVNGTRKSRAWSPESLVGLVVKGPKSGAPVPFVLTVPPLDGTIAPKSSWRGLVVFEVPTSARAKSVRLRGADTERGALVSLAKRHKSTPNSQATAFAGLEPTSEWGYFSLTGPICDTERPFELTATVPGSSVILELEPSGPTTGTVSFAGTVEDAIVGGAGQYTLEVDPDGTRGTLTLDTSGTGTAGGFVVPAFVVVETIELGPTSSC